ncbi:MAG: hypothetical protein HYY57_07075 [Candidatus Omnitrophica bacterium]|nr:hypothetical protein [Candidatus Omnitrophota bacterium]
MEARALQDPYRAVIQCFNRYGVQYVVVGMAGINYYANTPAQTFATMDYDLFIDPTIRNVTHVLQCLKRLKFTIGTAEGPLESQEVRRLVKDRRTLVATTHEGVAIELLLAISGYVFSEIARDAATFTVRGVPVKVGRLTKLLRSKKLAGRSKDRQFLRRYQSLLQNED